MKKPADRVQKKSNKTSAPALLADEDSAELARRLNDTLWAHIPGAARDPQPPLRERNLAVLGARNLLHRINLNYPSDILTVENLALATFDLMEALNEEGGTNSSSFLSSVREYIKYGFLLPRYWVRHFKKGWKHSEPLDFSSSYELIFDRDFRLQEIRFGWNTSHHDVIAYYRKRELLIEEARTVNPRHKDTRNLTPLFIFSQVAQLMKICRLLQFGVVNLLFLSPEDYQARREKLLPFIKQTLEEIGNPTFCANLACAKPLQNDSRNLYCDDRCQGRVIDSRKRARKSQAKELQEPLRDYTEILSLP